MIPFNHLIRQKQIIVKITEILRKNKKKKNREEKSIDSFKKKEKNRPQNLKNVPALSATFPRLPSTTVSTHRRTALFPRECSSKRASEQARERERERRQFPETSPRSGYEENFAGNQPLGSD